MKKQIENLGKFGVVTFALIAAFAFTTPKDLNQEKYGFNGASWINLTGQMPGQGVYDCLEPFNQTCTRTGQSHTAPPVEPGIIVFN